MKHFAASAGVLSVGLCMAGVARAHDGISVLYRFSRAAYSPYGNISLWHHQIFGTASAGGSEKCDHGQGCGAVYRLIPGAGSKRWVEETLYSFAGGADGGYPSTPVTVAPDGDVFGYTNTTTPGTIFRLVPPAQQGGSWSFQAIYTFQNGSDGNLTDVFAPLILDHGRLYGIASGGAPACQNYGCGSVFRLDPPAHGQSSWRLVTLYSFGANGRGAPSSIAGPDASGAFYVSTAYGHGAVVKLAARNGHADHWDGHIIATFPYSQYGYGAPRNLLLAGNGTLYGLDRAHGGDVFSLTPPADGNGGRWTLAELARIYGGGGYAPSSLAFGPGGSLIGVIYGDQDLYSGNAFQVSPPAGGSGPWTATVLWNFDDGPDQNPINIVADPHGKLFGVLSGGGYSNGTLFELRQ